MFQRGIVTPMANIEQLWRDYLEFEKNINPIIAEKMNIERGRDYMNARRVGKELEAETRGLNRHLPSVPPSGLPEEIKQVRVCGGCNTHLILSVQKLCVNLLELLIHEVCLSH